MSRPKQQARAELVRKTREVTQAHLTINGWFPVRFSGDVQNYGHVRWGMGHDEHGCFVRSSSGYDSFVTALVTAQWLKYTLPMEWPELRNGSFWKIYGQMVEAGAICKLP